MIYILYRKKTKFYQRARRKRVINLIRIAHRLIEDKLLTFRVAPLKDCLWGQWRSLHLLRRKI